MPVAENLQRLKNRYLKAKWMYYNDPQGRTLMSDEEFDALEDKIRELDPKWPELKKTGISVKKMKAKLPVPMASLDKVKPDTVEKWLEKVSTSNVVISDKLDGAALQLVYKDGVPRRLFTRGDGKIGGDISYLIPHLRIPQKVAKASFILRCEGLFSKAAFQKYKAEFDAARNAASGIFNRQDIHRGARDLSIVVLKVLAPAISPSQGLAWAKSKGFTVVPYRVVPTKKLNSTNLTNLVNKRKKVSKYQLDGIVIEEDKVNRITADRPDWAKAFKVNVDIDSATVTTVRKVHWDISARAQIIPRIEFDPVEFEGVKVRFASAFNAAYINKNSIAPGAKVVILRSGDVIPYVAKVVKGASKPSKPDPRVVGEYKLDKKGTNYVLVSPKDNDEFRIQHLSKFFSTLGVDFMRVGTVRRLYAAGFTNVKSIIKATPEDFLRIEGVKNATANKIYEALHSVLDRGVPLTVLMDASGTFPHGMGQTRFEKIAEQYDLMKLLSEDSTKQERVLLQIPGFGSSTIQSFIKGAPKFLRWLSVVGIEPVTSKKKKVKVKSRKLEGQNVTWTGYRDKGQEAIVQENGGQVVSFGSKTTVLLVSPSGKSSSKVDKARGRGIPVMTWDEFKRKFKL